MVRWFILLRMLVGARAGTLLRPGGGGGPPAGGGAARYLCHSVTRVASIVMVSTMMDIPTMMGTMAISTIRATTSTQEEWLLIPEFADKTTLSVHRLNPAVQ